MLSDDARDRNTVRTEAGRPGDGVRVGIVAVTFMSPQLI